MRSRVSASPLFSSGDEERLVFGDGTLDASVMLLGEAPGREEEASGIPFVGKGGRYLTSVLERVFDGGREGLYITNTVKIWPRINTSRGKTRPPTKEEREFFLPYLLEEIKTVGPRVIVAVGKTAFTALSPVGGFLPGTWVHSEDLIDLPKVSPIGAPPKVMAVYHPSYLLRKQRSLEESTRRLEEALRLVRDEAAGIIS